jgi:hypothetical protein
MWWRKLVSEETVTFNLELDVSKAMSDTRKLETVLYRAVGLTRRILKAFGLSEETATIDQVIYKGQKVIMTIRLMHTAITAFYAASGPLGYALAGVGIATSVLSFTDMLSGY